MSDIQAATRAIPLPSAEINLGGTATAEAQFLTASAQNGVAAGTKLVCYMPGSNTMKQRSFKVRVGGRYTTGTSAALTVSLYWGTSTTISSNKKIATGSALIATGSGNFFVEFEGMWDSTSAQILGIQRGYVNGVAIALAAITTSTSSVDLSGESTSNGFTVTGTFSSGNASNAAIVDVFEVIPQ